MKHTFSTLLLALIFWTFIAGKVVGVLTAWSWWWLLMPAVPLLGEAILRAGR